MDWARAKSIILVLLLAFNIFLGWMLISRSLEKNTPAETIKNTVTILESRGVTLKCEIPRYKGDLPKLKCGSFTYDRNHLAGILLGEGYTKGAASANTPVTGNESEKANTDTYVNGDSVLSFTNNSSFVMTDINPNSNIGGFSPKKAEDWMRRTFGEKGLIGGDYILDNQGTKSDGTLQLVFVEKYNGSLLFSNYVKAIVSAKGLLRMEASYREINGFTSDKITDMIPAYQILLKNIKGGEKQVITSIDLGYNDVIDKESTGPQSFEQLPVWRIKIEGKDEPEYYSAVNMGIPTQ